MPNFQWSEFIELGKDLEDSAVEERLKVQAPNTCATIIYTVCTLGSNPTGKFSPS